MPPTYSCNVMGTCVGQTAQQTILFRDLQREINRMRSQNGLAPDAAVDGKIGASTTAKLIKLMDKLISSGMYSTRSADGTLNVGAKLDPVLYEYKDFSSRLVAAKALSILQALQRNGFSAVYWNIYDSTHNPNPGANVSPGVTINPYGSTVSVNPGVKINPVVVSVLPVGPTAGNGGGIIPGISTVPGGGGYASPGFDTGEMPLWAKIGLGVLGTAAVVGVGAAVVRAVRR